MMYRYPLYGGYGMMGGWGWLLMLLFWALVIAAVVVAVVVLVRASRRHGMDAAHPGRMVAPGVEDPIDIAKRRLASGEITAAQFDEIVKALRG